VGKKVSYCASKAVFALARHMLFQASMAEPRPTRITLPAELGIQAWLEDCAQGYLAGTRAGRPAGASPPRELLENEVLRAESIRYTVQLLVAERCALAATAGLINAAPWESCKRYLATQVLDEARHVEVFTERLYELGVDPAELDDKIGEYAHPDLLGLSELVLERVHRGDVLAGLLGQGIVLDEIAAATYEMLESSVAVLDPAFSHAVGGILRDERRHTDVAERLIRELLTTRPEKKVQLAKLQRELTGLVVRTFQDAFRENPLPEEFRRVANALRSEGHANGSSEIRWAGIDLLASDASELEKALIKTVRERLKTRFQSLGMESYTTPFV
jgi:rubrerythrin